MSITEDELRDLAERTQEIHRLTEILAWDLFTDRAKAEILKHQKLILGGRLDLDDYHRETGWVQGALAVLALPEQQMEQFLAARGRYELERAQEEVEA